MLSPHAIFEEIRTNDDAFRLLAGTVGAILRWPAWKRTLLTCGARAIYVYERLWGWRRMVRLSPPARPNALGAVQVAG